MTSQTTYDMIHTSVLLYSCNIQVSYCIHRLEAIFVVSATCMRHTSTNTLGGSGLDPCPPWPGVGGVGAVGGATNGSPGPQPHPSRVKGGPGARPGHSLARGGGARGFG